MITQHCPLLGGEAEFSNDLRYRYTLRRSWGAGSWCHFVMLNPSTADAFKNDPTIRRCCAFARGWGHGGLIVTNLFAFRATDPRELKRVEVPVGPTNDAYILESARRCAATVCAWGNMGAHLDRGVQVIAYLRAKGVRPLMLAATRLGLPRHPLYVKGGTRPTPIHYDELNP